MIRVNYGKLYFFNILFFFVSLWQSFNKKSPHACFYNNYNRSDTSDVHLQEAALVASHDEALTSSTVTHIISNNPTNESACFCIIIYFFIICSLLLTIFSFVTYKLCSFFSVKSWNLSFSGLISFFHPSSSKTLTPTTAGHVFTWLDTTT